jgi:hypothetical protein
MLASPRSPNPRESRTPNPESRLLTPPGSGRHAYVVVKELRREVGAVRPDQRVELRMDEEILKDEGITQGLEYRTPKGWPEIDFTRRPILEPQPHDVIAHIASFQHVVVLHSHSSGAMRASGCPCRASCQLSNNSAL